MAAKQRRLPRSKWLTCLLLGPVLGGLVATCLIMLQVLSSCPSDLDILLYTSAASSGDWQASVCQQLAAVRLQWQQRPPALSPVQHPPRPPPAPPPPPASSAYLNPDAMPWAAEDGIELPGSDEDIERILRFPHVEECNLCRVCIPHEVVARHPKAQQKAREGMSAILDQGDLLLSTPAAAHTSLNSNSNLNSVLSSTAQQQLGAAGAGRRGRVLQASGQGMQREGDAGSSEEPEGERLGLRRRLLAAAAQLLGEKDGVGSGNSHGGVAEPNGAGGDGAGSWQGQQGTRAPGGVQAGGKAGLTRAEAVRKLAARQSDVQEADGVYRVAGRDVDIHQIAPGNLAPRRRHMRNCQVCWGCKHTLERTASGDILFNSYYAHEPGASPSWLFRVRTNRTSSGWAVVKVWCVPVQKVKQRGLAMCTPKKVFSQVKLLLAQQQITAKCGLNEIVPKLWIEPVHGVLPGHGFRVTWLGMWFDVVEGVSVQNIQEAGKPHIPQDLMINMFSTYVNHTEIKLGAIFDLLFSQCDRHQQNIFMTASGQLRFIDNDQVYGTAWRKCGIDSMIVPTTQKFMINHLGFGYVMKYPLTGPPTTWSPNLNPLLLLDYRCHVGGDGTIGTNFPPQVHQCMSELAAMTSEQILWQYGYPGLRLADAVRNRSRDMLEKGFEWTLLHGEPANQSPHRYKLAPPCCNMSWLPRTKFSCTTPGFKRMGELPFGNPWHGGQWHGKSAKDTGMYEGGTVF